MTIDRASSVYLFGRYHKWPLGTASIFRLPPGVLLRCLRDLLTPGSRRDGAGAASGAGGAQSFEEYIVSRYGRTLYEVFFQGYTTKFAHCTPDLLHHSWAQASIHRATIDRRYEQSSLLDVLRVALLPKPKVTQFLYPVGGIDTFARRAAERIREAGGQLFTGVEDLALEAEGGRVSAVTFQGRRVEPSYIVWTGTPGGLARRLGVEPPRLDFLDLLLFNVEVRGRVPSVDQWTYFSDTDLAISRISFPRNFYPPLIPEGKDGLCVEVTWTGELPDEAGLAEISRRVVGELERVRLAAPGQVQAVHPEVIREAYPVYRIDYPERLREFVATLAPYENLLCLGRCGTFWYNNMDDSMVAGLDLAEALAGPGPASLQPPDKFPGIIWPAALRHGLPAV